MAAAPSWATSAVGLVVFDAGRQALVIEASGVPQVQSKRLLNPDRLVIDLYDSTLAKMMPPPTSVQSRKIRSYRVLQYNASIVRIVVELQPGVDPLVALHQKPGQVTITLDDPLPSKGEKDLETLPPLELSVRAPEPMPRPTPRPTLAPVLPSPTPAPILKATPVPEAPIAWPSEAPFDSPEALPRVAPKREGFGSSVMLRWQQVEALEDYKAATGPVFGYPTGLNGVEVRHWFLPFLGFGLDSRLMTYDLTVEGIRQNRTDVMIVPQLVGRYPLLGGIIEPEVSLGYLGRHLTNSSALPGSSLPFSPTAFHHGWSLGGGGRLRLAPAVSLVLDYQYRPSVGGNLFKNFGTMDYGTVFPLLESRYEVALRYDVGAGFVAIGYSDQTSKSRVISYSQVIAGVLAGGGWRY